jgi:thiol:disulfide interchange protein DsbA
MIMLQRFAVMTAALGIMAGLLLTPSVQAAEFVEGVHYEKLDVPVETQNPDAVEVVEVFSYACVHCKTFDPTLEMWKEELPEGVEFRRLPAIFDQTWAWFAQAYYAAAVLGVSDQVHTPLFVAIHDQGVDLRDPSLMASLFEQSAGVDPAEFTQVVNSFGVRSRVQQADAHGRALRITGVPTLVVDGRYKVDGRMAGNNTNMLAVVDYLVAMRQEENAAAE